MKSSCVSSLGWGFLFWCRVSDADEFYVQRPPACRGSNESKAQGAMTEEEFNETVRSNFDSLVKAAESVLGCEGSAKDAVQKALVRVWKNIDSFDPTKATMRTLLHVSVKRQAISHQISRKRRITAMERFWGEIIPERPRKADPRIKGLMDALDELPEKKRALIQKRFFEGKKVEEVAKEMGLSKSATQGRLRHAEGALRRQYRKKIRT